MRAFAVHWPNTPESAADTPETLAAEHRPRVVANCLGSFKLLVQDVPLTDWRAGKSRALFQYLVTHHDRPIPRDTLINALWPNPSALAAGTSLKVAVHALRQTLAQVEGGREGLRIEAHNGTYRLVTSALWLDVDEFERRSTLGRELDAQERPGLALQHYAQAASLYRGDFLIEAWDDWVVFRREGLKDQYLFVLARLADAAQQAGDYVECILRCQQLLEQDRCREDTYRLLIFCHACLGHRDRVRRWYQLCVDTLRREIDSVPEPVTERVYRAALEGRLGRHRGTGSLNPLITGD